MAAQELSFKRLTFPKPTDEELQAFFDAVQQGDYAAHLPDRPRDGPYLLFEDDGMVWAGGESILMAEWLIADLRLTELRRVSRPVLRDAYGIAQNQPFPDDDEIEPMTLFVVDLPPEDFWPLAHGRADVYPESTVDLLATPQWVRAHVFASTGADTPVSAVEAVTDSVCAGAHAKRVEVEEVYRVSTEIGWTLTIEISRRGALAADLMRTARACASAVEALRGSTFDQETVAALVRAGLPGVLVGLPENAWFEAKRQLWDLNTTAGKVELAQDVARFANGGGGLLLVGAETRKVDGVDTVVRTRGIAPDLVDITRIMSVLDQRIYPAVDGLAVWSATNEDGRSIVAVEVPSQSEWMKPFLVHGSVVGDRVEGAFFSIVQRRGEGSIALSAREVHAWLAAGRRLTQGDGTPK